MCDPVTLTIALAATAGTAAVVQGVAAQNQAEKIEDAINRQNAIQAEQIQDAAENELNQAARAARRARGEMRVAASEAGINLGSNSFLAALQTSFMNQFIDQGLVIQNERGQQEARRANAQSAMDERAGAPTDLGVLFSGLTAAFQGYAAGKLASRPPTI